MIYNFHLDIFRLGDAYYDDTWEDFPVDLSDDEFQVLCDAYSKWKETDHYQKRDCLDDDEYYLFHYVPLLHKKFRALITKYVIENCGEKYLANADQIDIYIPEEIYYAVDGEPDPNDY